VNAVRLGELIVMVDPRRPLSRERLTGHVVAAGYCALAPVGDWQHFRPQSAWWQGLRRHAALRCSDLHVRLSDDERGRDRIHVVGLVTMTLELRLRTLGAVSALS
jgi:hypothetical protein